MRIQSNDVNLEVLKECRVLKLVKKKKTFKNKTLQLVALYTAVCTLQLMSVVPGLISVEQAGGQRSEVGTCADQEQNHSEQ